MTYKHTLKEVAARAGVSYQTVSKVLNGQAQVSNETRQRIMDAVHELRYRPNQVARNMRARRSRMIGYSWTETLPSHDHHFVDQFLSSIVHKAEILDYYLLLFPFRDGAAQVDDYGELFYTGRVDGFILSNVNHDDQRIRFLVEHKISFVAFGRSNLELDFPHVDVDSADGIRQVMQHLISRGHRRIAVIELPEDSHLGNERLRGFFESMEANGLEVRAAWIRHGEGTYEFGYEAASGMIELPASERPTAIVTSNDTQAIAVFQAAREHGLEMPRDIAVVGFGDEPVSRYLCPSLTTISLPISDSGRKCIEILITSMEGEQPEERHILLQPKLIVRDSA